MAPHLQNRTDRFFFGGMGLAMIVTVFLGFAASYYLRPTAAPPLRPLLHAHGLAASAWMLLFVAQTALVSARRFDLHRLLGIAGAALAIVLVALTTTTAIIDRGVTARLVFPAGAILMFLIYVGAGFMRRRDPDGHKRLMLLATISLLPPAISRLHLHFLPEGSVGPNFAGLFFLLPAFAYDWISLRRIHPALWWGSWLMIAMLPARVILKNYLS